MEKKINMRAMCIRCNGSGYILHHLSRGANDPSYNDLPCPECEGTGNQVFKYDNYKHRTLPLKASMVFVTTESWFDVYNELIELRDYCVQRGILE